MNHTPAPARGAADPAIEGRWRPTAEGAHHGLVMHEGADERDEAAQLAVTFAMDYMSHDEDDPHRRQQALARYLFAGPGDYGWSGVGRQRAEFAAAGRQTVAEDQRWVDVRVRVTPYRRRPPAAGPPEPPPPVPSPADEETLPASPMPDALPPTAVLAAAPAPDPLGWTALAAIWYRMSVPVRRSPTGTLFVDLAVPGPGGRS